MNILLRQLILFTIVGAIGFVADAGTLYVALWLGLGKYGGRVVSYLVAATVTWALNRRWTFAASRSADQKREWRRFVAFNLAGFVVNYGAYALALTALPMPTAYESLRPLLCVATGSAAGLVVNFAVNKWLVFRPAPPTVP